MRNLGHIHFMFLLIFLLFIQKLTKPLTRVIAFSLFLDERNKTLVKTILI